MEVNTEADLAQQGEIDMYEVMLDTIKRAQWKGVSESTIAPNLEDEKDSVDFRIRNALEQNVTIMLVPAPDNKITYYVSELIEGNTLTELPSMEVVTDGISFEEAKGMVDLNLIAELRDIMILSPNPKTTALDIYRIKKPGNRDIITPVSKAKEDVGAVLDFTYDSAKLQPWMTDRK